MQHKYRVDILDESGEVTESWDYTTKYNISTDYDIPLYMIEKIIKMTNNANYTTKRESHFIYRDLVKSMKIYLNKPPLNIQLSKSKRNMGF